MGADDPRSADLAYWPKADAPGRSPGKLAYSPRVRLETRDGYPLLRRDDYRLIPVILRDPKTDLDENFGFRITGPGGLEEFFSGSDLEEALSRFDALTVGIQR